MVEKEIQSLRNPQKAKFLMRFFKCGKGEYGEGDKFLGITVPQIRKIVSQYWQISISEVIELLHSQYHEERLCALLIFVKKYEKGDVVIKKKIYQFYLKNTKYINNWDLVDLSAEKIVGNFLADKSKKILYQLAYSKNLWERRIAILSTFSYIKKGESRETIKIAKILLSDEHDLIHKAVGWMLREVGKKCGEKILLNFLDKNASKMPRVMLRYSIEKFPEKTRKKYLSK